ncbi:unnamed protein product [Symbiodinium natans]|uniref:Uncharacterized protein n=1 Tax=Symbiodinium natans TaxID=878477 RepID=A0A812UAV6_9DINO|nr:unnamed protein product [Symbiodinium natans]
MEDGLLRTFHSSLAEPDVAQRREVALAARCLDRSSLGYNAIRALGKASWSEAESLLEADISLLRAQLGASAIWDPDLSARLRRWAAGGARAISAGLVWQGQLPVLGGALEASGAVEGDGLQILTNEAWSRGTSVAYVWVYRFRRAAAAAAHLSYHPALAAESPGLRAALLFRDPETGAQPDGSECLDVQVLLATTCRGSSLPPSGLPLPAAAAPTSLEMRLRQRALEVMSAEASGYPVLADTLRRDLSDLAASSGIQVPDDSSPPHFAVHLHDLANLEEEDGVCPRPVSRPQPGRTGLNERPLSYVSKRPPATSEEALLEADLAAALAAAQRLLKQDVNEVVKNTNAAAPRPEEPPTQPNQLALQQGLLQLARGLEAKALVHSGDKVPVSLAVNPDYTVNVEVAGESRAFQLTSIDEVACGEAALGLLKGCLSRPPPSRVCALRLKDGKCLALLLPVEVAPEIFVRCLLQLREGASSVSGSEGKVVMQSSRSSEGVSTVAIGSAGASSPPDLQKLSPREVGQMPLQERPDADRRSPATTTSRPRSSWTGPASGTALTAPGAQFLDASLGDTQPLDCTSSCRMAQAVATTTAWCQPSSPPQAWPTRSSSPPPMVHFAQTAAPAPLAARSMSPVPTRVLALPASAMQVQTLPPRTVVTQSMPMQPPRTVSTWMRTIVYPAQHKPAPEAPVIRTMPAGGLQVSTLQAS